MQMDLAKEIKVLDRETIACQICGIQNETPLFFRRDKFKIDSRPFALVRCGACDYFYVNPRPFPDQLMRFYPSTYAFQEDTESATSGLAKMLKKAEAFYRQQGLAHDVNQLLKTTKKKNGNVLEIGCATGDRLHLLKQKGFEVTGIEPSEAAQSYGEKHFGLSIVRTTLENWGGPQAKQDIICIFNVLEHLPYPIEQLKRLASWLKDDGVLVIQIPNASSWQAKWFGSSWAAVDAPRDLFYFTPQAMQKAAASTGLEICSIQYGHHWMHPPTIVSSLFPAIDPAVIWSEEGKSSVAFLKKIAWALATLSAIPWALIEQIFQNGAIMTLYTQRGIK